MRSLVTLLAVGFLAMPALAADGGKPFYFSPEPRWQMGPDEEPETETVCAAIRAECKSIKDVADISADFGYDALYDANGNLAGIRMTSSTGCTPLDEDMLISQRKFILAFHTEGKPDLDNIHLELAPGVDPDSVRIVKQSSTSISMGCNP